MHFKNNESSTIQNDINVINDFLSTFETESTNEKSNIFAHVKKEIDLLEGLLPDEKNADEILKHSNALGQFSIHIVEQVERELSTLICKLTHDIRCKFDNNNPILKYL